MSHGSGTMASPSGFSPKGTLKSSTKQHGLPANPRHTKAPDREELLEYWNSQHSKTMGTDHFKTRSEGWTSGDFWNCDSNVRKWTLHQVKRNAASANYGLHAPDQMLRNTLQQHEDEYRKPAKSIASTSGMLPLDEWHLGPQGFNLGARDRTGMPLDPPWRPVGMGQMFRGPRSHDRNISRLAEYKRSLMLSGAVNPIQAKLVESAPTLATPQSQTLLEPLVNEDILGETITKETPPDQIGAIFDSRSCRYWDEWGHTTRRDAARCAYSLWSPSVTEHREGHPTGDTGDLRPAFVYTKKFKKRRAESMAAMDPLAVTGGSS